MSESHGETSGNDPECSVCSTPMRVVFIVAGEPVCPKCYEQLVAGAAKIAEYNAAVDLGMKK